MKILKLKARNFYSFKDLELDINDYKGIVRVSGKNRDSGGSNGSGKSSIFEAIVFGIFGKTIKKSTEESLVNTQAGKDCKVSVEIDKNGTLILIERTKRPTSLNLFVNGENKNKEAASETQKVIEELLQTDYKSFLTSTAFGQHSDFNFLDSSPEDKRNIIKNCFNLEEFFSKRNAVKDLKSKYTSELKAWSTILEALKNDKTKLEKEIPDKKFKYVDLPPLHSILDAEKDINTCLSSVKNIMESIKAEKDKLRKIDSQLKQGIYHQTSECPVCKSPYEKCQTQDDVTKLEFDKRALESSIAFNTAAVESLKAQIDALKPVYNSQEWAKINEKNKLVLDAQAKIDALNKVLESVAEKEKKILELSQQIEVMKFWELAFSEKGIVKYIIRNILEYFNLRCNEYISILTNNQFSIQFNDELAEVIQNNGSETKYISLSGGEKRKVNLAIMLALQDLSSKISKTECNLIFFDEVCDNIDDLGIEAIHNLLNTLTIQYQDKVILLITHNNLLNQLFSESQEIKVVKEKGISRLI